jgi:hypothetical protein
VSSGGSDLRASDEAPEASALKRLVVAATDNVREFPVPPLDLEQVVKDLRLIAQARAALTPLEKAGFTLADGYSTHRYSRVKHAVTLLTRADGRQYFLIHLPSAFMDSATVTHVAVLGDLQRTFPDGSHIYIVSHPLDAIHPVLMNTLACYSTITAQFVPWRHIRPTDMEEDRAVDILIDILNLRAASPAPSSSATGPPPPGPPPRTTPEERALIADILATILGTVSDADVTFRDLVGRLQLENTQETRARALFTDDLGAAAARLVHWAANQDRRVLGRIIHWTVDDGPGREEAQELAAIARRCELMDQERLHDLDMMIKRAQS